MQQTVGPDASFHLHSALLNLAGWPDTSADDRANLGRAFDALRDLYALNLMRAECERIGGVMVARFWEWQATK